MDFGVRGYWNTNLGDDLFLKILAERFPQHNFHIITFNQNYKVFKKYENIKSIEIEKKIVMRIFNKIRNILFRKDYYEFYLTKFGNYIEIGGSLFMQDHDKEVSDDLVRRTEIVNKVDNYWVIGSNFGPYFMKEQVNQYSYFFSKCTAVVFRDENSKKLFNQLSNVSVAPDVVFNLDVSNYSNLDSEGYIVISVLDLITKSKEPGSHRLADYNTNYMEKIQEIVKEYISMGKDVYLMSFCDNQNDDLISKQILKNMNHNKNIILFSHKDIEESLELLAKADRIITTRFHGLILSFLLKKPVLALIYSQKTLNVINDIDESLNYFTLDKISELNVKNLEDYYSVINDEVLNKLIIESNKQFESLEKFIIENN